MNQQSSGNSRPTVNKWLWITLVTVILIGGALATWYYLMGPGKTVETAVTTTATSTVTSDTTALKSLCKKANPGLDCEVSKIEGDYAKGTIPIPSDVGYLKESNSAGSESWWYAKKVNGVWTIIDEDVYDDIPSCAKTSGFPTSIVATCATE